MGKSFLKKGLSMILAIALLIDALLGITLHKGIVGMRFLLFGGSSFPLQRIKSSMDVFSPKGSRERAESPLVASADAKSPAMKKISTGIVSRCWSVAPIWRGNIE